MDARLPCERLYDAFETLANYKAWKAGRFAAGAKVLLQSFGTPEDDSLVADAKRSFAVFRGMALNYEDWLEDDEEPSASRRRTGFQIHSRCPCSVIGLHTVEQE